VVDYLAEIPLRGRAFGSTTATVRNPAPDIAMSAFVAGPENRLVAATFSNLLEGANSRSATTADRFGACFRPAVIAVFGSSGAGKTHLSRGLVQYWRHARGVESAEYVTANDFRRRFVAAMNSDAILSLRQEIRGRELLAIDDLHQLPANPDFWQELRYTLDDYEEQGGLVLLTSDRAPTTLPRIPTDVASRLASGLMLQLSRPGVEARVQIIRQAARALGHTISDDAAHRLAAGLNGTAGELFGALFELLSGTTNGNGGDLIGADRLLADRASRRPELHEIIALVARHCGQSQKVLKSSSRMKSTVFARALVVYCARELSGASYEDIGRSLGGRDHTTVMHSYNKINRERQRDLSVQDTIDELSRILLIR
jgi:chromosomal replication initiator protein